MGHRTTTILLSALLAFTGCGVLDPEPAAEPAVAFAQATGETGDTRYAASRSWLGNAPAPDALTLEAELQGQAYVVAPDRVIVRADLRADGPSRAAAVGRIQDASGALVAAMTSDLCRAEVVDYGMPGRAGDGWAAHAVVRVDVPLAGLEHPGPRLDRVEACLARFDGLGERLAGVDIRVSAPLPTVDDPSQHRTVLLRRAMHALDEVAQTEGPTAFDREGMRCVSQGQVTITRRTLHGVGLEVDLACAPRPVTAAAPAAAPAAGAAG